MITIKMTFYTGLKALNNVTTLKTSSITIGAGVTYLHRTEFTCRQLLVIQFKL